MCCIHYLFFVCIVDHDDPHPFLLCFFFWIQVHVLMTSYVRIPDRRYAIDGALYRLGFAFLLFSSIEHGHGRL